MDEKWKVNKDRELGYKSGTSTLFGLLSTRFFISLDWTLFKVIHLRFVTLLKNNWEDQQAAKHTYYLLCQCLKAVKGNKSSLKSHPEWVQFTAF